MQLPRRACISSFSCAALTGNTELSEKASARPLEVLPTNASHNVQSNVSVNTISNATPVVSIDDWPSAAAPGLECAGHVTGHDPF